MEDEKDGRGVLWRIYEPFSMQISAWDHIDDGENGSPTLLVYCNKLFDELIKYLSNCLMKKLYTSTRGELSHPTSNCHIVVGSTCYMHG